MASVGPPPHNRPSPLPPSLSPPPANLTALETLKVITYPHPPPDTIAAFTTRSPPPPSAALATSPPGSGGLWGDLTMGASRPRSASTSSASKMPTATVKAGKDNKGKAKGRAARVSKPPPRPPIAPGRTRAPRTKAECLSRFVFPELVLPRISSPLYGPDMFAALKTLGTGTLTVQYHAGLTPLLARQLENVAGIPPAIIQRGSFEHDAAECYANFLHYWMSVEQDMAEHALRRHADDLDLIDAWFHRLATPINDMLLEGDTFRPGGRPKMSIAWSPPSRIDAAHRQHDWLAWSDTEISSRAIMSWRLGATDSDIGMLYTKAIRCRPPTWRLDVSPGYHITQRGGEIITPEGLPWGSAALALLAWQGMHHYHARWTIVFNGATAIVCYLAKGDTLFISEPIWNTSGKHHEAVTVASAMFALCAMNHHSDRNRPSVTMRDDAIQFYPRPHITPEEWAALERHEEKARTKAV